MTGSVQLQREPIRFLAWIVLGLSLLASLNLQAETRKITPSSDPVSHFIHLVKAEQLWSRREWQILLHYSPRLLTSSPKSLVDDAKFFLSPTGKTSPQAELEATIRALFVPDDDEASSLACRFPARRAWLLNALNLKENEVPHPSCPNLQNWLSDLQGDGLTLVFPVSVLNSPASLFGHTFLRIDRKANEQPDLLAWTISYAAHANEEKGINFAFKGLSGGYHGKFSVVPYHARVKAYTDIESRDIWEYQLNFSKEEIRKLLLHCWELLPVYSDYFFIDENCAFQLLTLLEAARPELHLSEKFRFDAMPLETVRQLSKIPGLLLKISFRPSNELLINSMEKRLSQNERELALQLQTQNLSSVLSALRKLPRERQARILDLSYLLTQYQANLDRKSKASHSARLLTDLSYGLLKERSQLKLNLDPNPIDIKPRPEQGHPGRRISIRSGYQQPQFFQQLDFRWAYHDLYDLQQGYASGAQLEFLKPTIRYYPESAKLQLEGMDLANIISMPARSEFIKSVSWEASAAINRKRLNARERPLMADFKGGIGLSHVPHKKLLLGYFAESELLLSDEFARFAALSVGGRLEAIWQISGAWKLGLRAQMQHYFVNKGLNAYQFGIKQQYALNQTNALELEISRKRDFSDSYFSIVASWHYYF